MSGDDRVEYPACYGNAVDLPSVEQYWDTPGDALHQQFVAAYTEGVTHNRGATVWIQPQAFGTVGLASEVEFRLRYLLGIRAEAIVVETEPGEGLIRATVVVVEPLGSHNLITARAGDDVLKISAPNHFFPEHGADIWLRLRAAQIRWVDRETGKVIATGAPV